MMGPTLSNLGGIRQVRGDLDGAQKLYAEAIEVARKTDDHTGEVTATINSAETLRLRGRLAESKQQYERGIAVAREMHSGNSESYAVAGLGELALLRDDLAGARRLHTNALQMRRKANETLTIAQSEAMLANLTLEEGKDPASAEASLRAAITVFAKEHAAEDESLAHETLARALLARSESAEAEKEIARARALAKGSRTVTLLAAISATEGRVLLAAGHADAAAAKAQESAVIAHHGQLLAAELDARLVGAAADLRRGKKSEAQAALARIRQRASAAGLLLYARKADSKTF
jgi:ATP/maltotriose-dependent transcriptional regulator MalT